MRILHTGDFHVRDGFIKEAEKCLGFLVEQAKKERPDIILIAGDIYDSNLVKADSSSVKLVFKTVSSLANIAPVAIITGTPSHENKATVTLGYIKAKHNVHVSTYPEQIYLAGGHLYRETARRLIIGGPEAVISMLPAPTKEFFQSEGGIVSSEAEIAQGLTVIMAGFAANAGKYNCHHILMGHWQVGGAFVSETQQLTGIDIQLSKDQVSLAKADLVCLGHLHLSQKINPNIFYSGSLYSNNWGELEDKGFYLFDITSGEIEPRFIKAPSTKMIDLEFDVTKNDFGKLDTVLYTHDKEAYQGTKVRLTIKIFVDEVEKLDQPGIKAFFESVGAALDLQIIRLPRENVRSKRILELDGLYDKILENADILNEPVPPGIKQKAERLEAGDGDALLAEVKAL